MPAEVATLVPDRERLIVGIRDDHVPEYPHPLPHRILRHVRIKPAQLRLVLGMQWRKNRGDTLLRAPSNASFRRRERLEQRRGWRLYRFWDPGDSTKHTIFAAPAPLFFCLSRPGGISAGATPPHS